MAPKLQEFLDDLALVEDRADRIELLISISDEFVNPPEAEVPRTAATRVPGCESEVFIVSEPFERGRKYKFAVENPQGISARAMARILDLGLSGEPPEVVNETPDDLAFRVFGNELSMG